MAKINKVVLAYSGGLDTSVIIKWLIENYGCEVIAFVADLGQGEDLESIKEKALATGATKAHVYDLREEFVKDFVFPMLRANAIYEGGYLLGTSIARPIIGKAQMDLVKKEGAEAVAHGSTGKGNDQVRFELTYYVHNPHIKDHFTLAGVGLQIKERPDRICKKSGYPDYRYQSKTLQCGQKSSARKLRGWRIGGPLGRST